MSKKDEVSEEKINKDFEDLISKVQDYYSTREASTKSLQNVGLKLNEKIDNYKPTFWENIKSYYSSSKLMYNTLSMLFLFAIASIVGLTYYFQNYTAQPIPGQEPEFKTKIIPQVALTKSDESELGVDTDSIFSFAAEKPINKQSLEDNIKVSPEFDYTVNWKSDTEVEILPNEELDINTEYSVILGTGTQFGEEEPILDELVWKFKTRPSFTLTGITPRDDSESAPYDTAIEFEFNYKEIDLNSFNENFVIEPVVAGHAEVFENKVVFLPDDKLTPYEEYTVSLKPGVKNQYGEETTQVYTSTFKVANSNANGVSLQLPLLNIYSPSVEIANQAINPYIKISTDYIQTEVVVDAYRLTEQQFVEYLNTKKNPSEELSAQYNFTPNENDDQETVDLSNLEKGLYYIEVSSSETESKAKQVINYSDYGLFNAEGTDSAQLWVFDLKEYKVLTSGSFNFYKENEDSYTKVATVSDFNEEKITFEKPYDLIIGTVNDQLSVLTKAQSGENEDYWNFDHWSTASIENEEYRVFFYTDRPLYQPGDTVHFKAIIRKGGDFNYRIPEGQKVKVVVPKANSSLNLFEEELTVNEFGTITGSIQIPNNYFNSLEVKIVTDDESISSYYYVTVTPYSKPQFEIDLELDKDSYKNGETAHATVNVKRYTGEPYQGQIKVKTCFDSVYTNDWPNADYLEYYKESGPYISCDDALQTMETDSNGYLKVDKYIEYHSDSSNVNGLQFYVEIPGEGESPTNSQRSVLIYEGDYDLFVKTETNSVLTGDTVEMTVGSFLSGTNNLVDGVPFDAEIERHWSEQRLIRTDYDYKTKKSVPVYETIQHEEIVKTFEGITNEYGEYTLNFTTEKDGYYYVNLISLDGSNSRKDVSYVFSSKQEIEDDPWNSEPSISIEADKAEAYVGDNVKLTISPNAEDFKARDAILISFRGNVYDSQKIEVRPGESVTIETEISKTNAPRVYYAVIFPDEYEVYTYNEETSPIQMSVTKNEDNVKIIDNSKQLNIETKLNKQNYLPGEEIEIEIFVKDQNGNGVETELSLSAVDKALLEAQRYFYERDIFESFYLNISDFVSTYTTNRKESYEGGRGDAGGGENDRDTFEDTAFWMAQVTTDQYGYAKVKTELPDNLTAWVLDAKGVSKDTSVGQAKEEFRTIKDAHVDYSLPTFVRVNDEIILPVKVSNYSGNTLSGTLSIEAEGAEVLDQVNYEVNIENNKTLFYNFKLKVTDADSLKTRIALKIGEDLIDATTKETTIYKLSQINTSDVSKILTQYDNTLVFNIDENSELERGNYQLDIRSSILSRDLIDSYFPNSGSSHDIAAIIIRNVTLLNNYEGLNVSKEKDVIILETKAAIDALLFNQVSNGGFGWFSYDTDNIETSSVVMYALATAKTAGFEVPDTNLEQLSSYLKSKINSSETSYQNKALGLYALSKTKDEDAFIIGSYLSSKKEEFAESPSTLAYLSLTLFEYGSTGDGIMLASMIEKIPSGETERWAYWEEPESMFNIVKSKPVITLLCYDVLQKYKKDLAVKAGNYVLENPYSYATTPLEKALRLETIIKHHGTEIGAKDIDLTVYINDDPEALTAKLDGYGHAWIEIPVEKLISGENTIRLESNTESENFEKLYVKVSKEEYVPTVSEANNGIEVQTSFLNMYTESPQDEFNAGDPVIMQTTIKSSHDGQYADINSMVPAGMDILNYYLSSYSNDLIREFYKNSTGTNSWGTREQWDTVSFHLYEVKEGETYTFRIPLIAKTKGTFSTTGSAAYFVNSIDINGQSEVKSIVIK